MPHEFFPIIPVPPPASPPPPFKAFLLLLCLFSYSLRFTCRLPAIFYFSFLFTSSLHVTTPRLRLSPINKIKKACFSLEKGCSKYHYLALCVYQLIKQEGGGFVCWSSVSVHYCDNGAGLLCVHDILLL
jgi:hypothetical protein